MMRPALYVLGLTAWLGAAIVCPQWTAWTYTQRSPSVSSPGEAPDPSSTMVPLSIAVSPSRAPLWDPPGLLGLPTVVIPHRWPWEPRPVGPDTRWVEISALGLAADITLGVLCLGVIFAWAYPFHTKPPGVTEGVALGTSGGLVLGWLVLLVPWAALSRVPDGSAFNALAAATLGGAAYGSWSAWRLRTSARAGREGARPAGRVALANTLWLSGGLIIGAVGQNRVEEAAVGLSRAFGWSLQRDPVFGTYSNAPAIEASAFLLWIALLVVAWVRWRPGPRAFAVGLAMSVLLFLL